MTTQMHGTLSILVQRVFAAASLTLILFLPDWRIALSGDEGCADDIDDVADYALKCYERVGIDKAAMEGPFNCKIGTPLYTTEKGKIRDLEIKNQTGEFVKNPDRASTFPNTCDKPAWLAIDGVGESAPKCYGNSYIQQVASGDHVQAALLCRHKFTWSNDDKTFDDVAIILHNYQNGQTCWFQVEQKGKLNGKEVPGPHTDAGKKFWWPPAKTAAVNCIRCHDNGPWMNSRWLYDGSRGMFEDSPASPYVNQGIGFDKWRKPEFVDDGGACTACHKIHVAVPKEKSLGGRAYQSCLNTLQANAAPQEADGWILRTTGQAFASHSNVTPGRGFHTSYWMPPNNLADAAQWKAKHKGDVDHLMACCTAQGQGVTDCKKYDPQVRAPAPRKLQTALGSSVSANTFINIQAIVNNVAGPAATNTGQIQTDFPAGLSDDVFIYWQAFDAVPDSCTFTESLSPGGVVPSSTSSDMSGFQRFPLHAGTQQSYSLTCRAMDGNWTTVTTRLGLPARGKPCDINGDGKVDVNDINLIMSARGDALTGPDDPRDTDRDGAITIADARQCALRCTKSGCVS